MIRSNKISIWDIVWKIWLHSNFLGPTRGESLNFRETIPTRSVGSACSRQMVPRLGNGALPGTKILHWIHKGHPHLQQFQTNAYPLQDISDLWRRWNNFGSSNVFELCEFRFQSRQKIETETNHPATHTDNCQPPNSKVSRKATSKGDGAINFWRYHRPRNHPHQQPHPPTPNKEQHSHAIN